MVKPNALEDNCGLCSKTCFIRQQHRRARLAASACKPDTPHGDGETLLYKYMTEKWDCIN
jgi:hypothetical protein